MDRKISPRWTDELAPASSVGGSVAADVTTKSFVSRTTPAAKATLPSTTTTIGETAIDHHHSTLRLRFNAVASVPVTYRSKIGVEGSGVGDREHRHDGPPLTTGEAERRAAQPGHRDGDQHREQREDVARLHEAADRGVLQVLDVGGHEERGQRDGTNREATPESRAGNGDEEHRGVGAPHSDPDHRRHSGIEPTQAPRPRGLVVLVGGQGTHAPDPQRGNVQGRVHEPAEREGLSVADTGAMALD